MACSLANHPNDTAAAEPTLAALAPKLDTPPAAALDTGFFSATNIAAWERRHIKPYVAPGRAPQQQSWQARCAGAPAPPPPAASPQVKMACQLRTEIGQAIWRLRKCTVEPIFGSSKAVRGFRQCVLRGLAAASAAWRLVCLAYNIQRYHTLRLG